MKHSFSAAYLLCVCCICLFWATPTLAQRNASVPPDSVSEFDRLYNLVEKYQYDDMAVAMNHAVSGLELAQKEENLGEEVRFRNSVSQIYFIVGELPLALDHSLRAAEKAKKMDSPWQLGNIFNAIGSIHFEQGDSLELALDFFEKSLAIRREHQTEGAVAGSLNNIGRVLLEIGQYGKSRKYLDEAIDINRRTGNWRWEVFNQMNFSILAQKEEKFSVARLHSLEGIKLCDEHIFDDGRISLMALLAETENLAGNTDQEINWQLQIAESKMAPGMLHEIADAHHALSKHWEEKGRSDLAYASLLKYTAISDSILKKERRSELANVESRHKIYMATQAAEQELEQQTLAKEEALSKAHLRSWLYLMGALLLLLFASVLYIAYRAKRIHNEKLKTEMELRRQELVETSEELNHFIYKSSHELHGPIKSIQGLLQLHEMDPSGEYMPMIQEKTDQLEAEHSQLIHSMELKHREPQIQELDLAEEMGSCVAMLEGRLNIKINLNWKNSVAGKIYSDSWVLKTMVRPILEQAVLHHDSKIPIEVETSMENSRLKVVMVADGEPKEKDYTSRIFQMFSGHGNRRSSLYNARLAADRLGGQIEIEVGTGKMTFTALVPSGEPT